MPRQVFLHFIGLWDVWSGKTQPVQIEQQMEAAGGAAASAGQRQLMAGLHWER